MPSLACSAAREWDIRGHGDYNFKTNREGVIRFWQERLDELSAQQEVMYTLGMRGKHDGVMQGTTSEEESLAILHEVLGVQRHMLQEKYGHEMPPQVFIPYKEVLTLYRKGLAVPDDVTLMWTDDNYGYMQHLPTPQERERSGGNGLYYHASYWGRPHDYLWLGSQSPYLMACELTRAYYSGIHKVWVLNVGAIKSLEYQLSLFADLAWDINCLSLLQPALAVKQPEFATLAEKDVYDTALRNALTASADSASALSAASAASAALTAPASAATTVTTAATTATAGTLAPAAAATTVAHTYELPHLLTTATWGVKDHLQSFYQEFLPADMAKQAADLVNEFYRLSFRRKPEFMCNTREEEEDAAWRQIKDLPFSAELTAKLIAKHQAQLTAADDFFSQVPADGNGR